MKCKATRILIYIQVCVKKNNDRYEKIPRKPLSVREIYGRGKKLDIEENEDIEISAHETEIHTFLCSCGM